ncbi:MAG: CAP domain-containing protein [Clostridiales bacterium]|nr:CAP domain-containing protein [Clostridiales bacterium]
MKKTFSLLLSLVMIFTLTFGITCTASAGELKSVSITVIYGQSEARTILSMINKLRTGSNAWYWNSDNKTKTVKTDLKALTYDYDLEKIAMQRAAEIAVYFSHTRPNGESCFTAYSDAEYIYYAAGENIAYGQTDAQWANDDWTEEDCDYSGQGHRRNMLSSSYTAVGIAHVYYNGVHYWVEEFSSSVGSSTYTKPNDSSTKCTIVADTDVLCIYKNVVTKVATLEENGKITTKCTLCGDVKSTTKIYSPTTFTLSKTSYTYDGETHKPSVTVKDSKGNKISSKYYTLTYSNSKSKYVGKYTVKIKFKGNYSGTKTLTYTIKPRATSISNITAKSKGFTVKWSKKTAQTTGYQIQYSTNKNYSSAKTVTISKNSTGSKTISSLKSKKKYYVRVRTYKTVDGKKYYSSWSKTKTVTTKK